MNHVHQQVQQAVQQQQAAAAATAAQQGQQPQGHAGLQVGASMQPSQTSQLVRVCPVTSCFSML